MAFVLSGCEQSVAGTPTAVSVVEEAAESGSAIPLPETLSCPAGGRPVVRIGGEIAVAQSFIADRYKDDVRQGYLAANYPELRYEASNGMVVYCGETNVQNGVEHHGKMIIPNSCVDSGGPMGEVGALVYGVDPIPDQPWWDDATGAFTECPTAT